MSGFEGDRIFTLHDEAGEALWSRKIQLPETDDPRQYQHYFFEWLDDNSLFIYTIRQKELFMTRLDSNGSVLWSTVLSMKDKNQIYEMSNPVLSSNGGLSFTLHVDSTKQNSSHYRIVSLDQSGKVTASFQLKQPINTSLGFLTGSEEDFWISGYTNQYAFGSSSAILFHYLAGEDTSCFLEEIDVFNQQEAIIVNTIPEEKDLELTQAKIKTSSVENEGKQQPIRILTKELCP